MRALRIGVNALYLIPGGVGGTEIYLRKLLSALAEIDKVNTFVVFTNRETGSDLVPNQPNFIHVPQAVRATSRPLRMLWEQSMLPLALSRHSIDVLLNPGFTTPAIASCRLVTVFHDLQHKRHPEYFRRFDLPFWQFFLWLAARRSHALLADSDATRNDLLKYYRLPESKIQVVPLGVDEHMFEVGILRAASRAERYILCVSTLHPHKNINRLLEAFREFRKAQPEYRLVLAGMRGFHAAETEQLIARLGLQDSVTLTGWIPREELYALYRDAHAFIYPSTFEGFGLPVLEALAAGIPTACSAIEPLATIAGPAALQFDPNSTDAIRDALRRLTCDEALRTRLTLDGPVQARHYSWRAVAENTLSVLTRTAQPRSKSSS